MSLPLPLASHQPLLPARLAQPGRAAGAALRHLALWPMWLGCAVVGIAVAATPPRPRASAARVVMPPALEVLECALDLPSVGQVGRPLNLQLRLTQPSPQPVQMLIWGTPFEGEWSAPFVRVLRDGVALPYLGAMAKRAEPTRDDYLRLSGRSSVQAGIDLAQAFDLGQPGRYEVQPEIRVHDLWATVLPRGSRPIAQHEPQELNCPPQRFELIP